MDVLSGGIRLAAQANQFSPAIIRGRFALSYGELAALIALIADTLSRAGKAGNERALLRFENADSKLIAAIACIHCGIVPMVVGNDIVIGPDAGYDFILSNSAGGLSPQDVIVEMEPSRAAATGLVLGAAVPRRDDDIMYVCTSSGTTGAPKLVGDPFKRFLRRGRQELGAPAESDRSRIYASGDRVLATLGDLSKYAVGIALRVLGAGATLMRAEGDAPSIARAVHEHGVTHLITTPGVVGSLADFLSAQGADFGALRHIELTGSLVWPELAERLSKTFTGDISVRYGTAEVGGIAAAQVAAKDFKAGYVGKLLPGVGIITEGTPSVPGALAVMKAQGEFGVEFRRGKSVSAPPRIYNLPDIGYLLGDDLFVLGRSDEVFNAGGNKIAYGVLETAIHATGAVADLALVGGGLISQHDQLLIAYVPRGEAGTAPILDALLRASQERSALDKVSLLAVPAIVRSVAGKVDRNWVARQFMNQPLGQRTNAPG